MLFPSRYHTQKPAEQRHLKGGRERLGEQECLLIRRKAVEVQYKTTHTNNGTGWKAWSQTDAQIENDRRRLTDEVTDSAEPALVLRAKDVAMRLAGRLAAHDRREPSMISLHVEKRSSELDNWMEKSRRPGVSSPLTAHHCCCSQLAVRSSKR